VESVQRPSVGSRTRSAEAKREGKKRRTLGVVATADDVVLVFEAVDDAIVRVRGQSREREKKK
jgi:hypothetical protein